MSNETLRKELNSLFTHLKMERASFEQHWQLLANNILPRRIRLSRLDRNKGDRRNSGIKDETPIFATRTLSAGLMGGVTSPSRPWFKLDTSSGAASLDKEASMWLHDVEKRIRSVFIKSNLYRALPVLYKDLGTFGTAAISIDEDPGGNVVSFSPMPIGSFYLSQNDKGEVNIFVREFEMTVRQIVSKFGRVVKGKVVGDNISLSTKLKWDMDNKEQWITVLHTVRPNDNHDATNPLSKEFQSVYMEQSSDGDSILSDGGFSYFPILGVRWEVTGEDIYATNCPGMEALPAIMMLHKMETRGLQAIEKIINPPMIGPHSLRKQKASVLPGDITYADIRQGMTGFVPLYQIKYDIGAHEAKTEQIRQRVRKAFFEDLFLMFQNFEGRDRVTAAEIDAKAQEKLLILGPILEQLDQDLLDPLVTITFNIMASQGLIPVPPESISGQGIRIEYVSIMHQAQKSLGLSSIDRLKQHSAELAQLDPQSLDKVDFDKMTDEYANILGVPPELVRSDDQVTAIRRSRLKQQQAKETVALQQQQAELQIKGAAVQASAQ